MISDEHEEFFDKTTTLRQLLNDKDICTLITALRGNDFSFDTI